MSAVARLRVFLLLLVLVGLPFGAGPGVIARAADARAADELSAIAQGLVSHKALYGLTVAKLDARNYRNGIAGGLSLEFLNACDGYVLNQRFLIETNTEDGTLINDMVLNSWESLDGQRFRFKMKDEVNGDLEQELAGEGTLKRRGESGLVRFTQPEDTDLVLPAGTAFPTEHTMRLIQMARTGGNWLHAAIFDGASAEGYSEVGGFIGGELPVEKGDTPLLAPLKGQRSWRVRLAYFTSDKAQDTPDYEVAYRLFENGVVDDIVFDYGDYAIRATLKFLELKPRDPC